MFQKVLIANRGAIACRIIRTLRELQTGSVAVYSRADNSSLHINAADEAVCLGEAQAADTYLSVDKILQAARDTGAQAIHPGYGFLSENAGFAERCEADNIAFIGPTPEQMRLFGLKHTARELAVANNVPLLPGSDLLNDLEAAKTIAAEIGYPIMLKSSAGGGGIGMAICHDETALVEAFESVKRLSQNNFGDAGVFLEKYLPRARHIEVQVFGDGKGGVIALGERDCSLQRRNQKVVEETPAPGLSDAIRTELHETACRLMQAVNYRSAGTVEFLYADGEFYFLEVNTRLQVEHGVTEAVTGVDLVAWMVQLAAGEFTLPKQRIPTQGHSVQARIYAEDPGKDFQPSAGLLTQAEFPVDARCDTWVETGTTVPPFYDPLLAKLIVCSTNREMALTRLNDALAQTRLAGIETNLAYLQQVVTDPTFQNAQHYTRYLNDFAYQPSTVDVLDGGAMTTVQDYPGRLGYWSIGVPPSGPMDALAFQLGNRLLNNPPDAAGLECTVTGPTLKFNTDCVIALTGAAMQAELDGATVPFWRPLAIRAGSVLKLGAIDGAGQRTYLSVKGGIHTPAYLGSRATFTLGGFGGHGGRALRAGDVLHVESSVETPANTLTNTPEYRRDWQIRVIYGPHGAPDFFTDTDIDTFFDTRWEVHYHSTRTGVRLIGPKPEWARTDGGEAGLHPSNLHDNAYAIGAIDFTGDMPIILGPDGPSLGGFVCPAVIIAADRWKMGQLKAGDKISFTPVSVAAAEQLEHEQHRAIETLQFASSTPTLSRTSPVLFAQSGDVAYRAAGDKYLLVEYGEMTLDLTLRFRVNALRQWLIAQNFPEIIDLTPGIRSLQIHYDSLRLPQRKLLDILQTAEAELQDLHDVEIPSRIIHLPLSWDDPATREAIEKYTRNVRPDAPWCPSNIEFIRRINGLDDIEQVKDIVFSANYLVMGLGDVYLGAPVATPMDPRHRLVTTKYNPARTWTPENAVGIGGAYMCIYGMEGPGGYQFVGRTVQVWNRHKQTADFVDGKPWLLRFFDQIKFYPVSAEELQQLREDFPQGRFKLKIEESRFHLGEYQAFLADNQQSIAAFKNRQQAAFDAERQRWIDSGQAHYDSEPPPPTALGEVELKDGEIAIKSHVAGGVWQIHVEPNQAVKAGETLVTIESMKMEIAVESSCDGVVTQVLCNAGQPVEAGQVLVAIKTS